MVTLLDERKPVARKPHTCDLCLYQIDPGESYLRQRCADGGIAWTFKAHHECNSAYWSWNVDGDYAYHLTDLTDGHLPPCRHAWNKLSYDLYFEYRNPVHGPPDPCTCKHHV